MSTDSETPRHRRTIGIAVVVAAAVLAAVVVVLVTRSGDDNAARVVPVTSSTTPTTSQSVDTAMAVWPAASSAIRYQDPVSAARAFAVDYIGFVDPVVGEYRAGDSRSGEVPVQRNATGPETTVLVRELGTTWYVLGCQTANIQLSSPAAREAISSPVTLRGMSTAFEATVNVEIREDGNSQPLARTIFMGGANGQMAPYTAVVSFSAPHARWGALVLSTISAEDGHVAEATVVRIAFTD